MTSRWTDEQYAAYQAKRARACAAADGLSDQGVPVLTNVVAPAPPAANEPAVNKYHNVKTCGYASRREATRAAELELLEKSGAIADLRKQVLYLLIPNQHDGTKCVERSVKYFADFVYVQDGKTVVEDCKGVRTTEYVIKRKLMLFVYGIRLRET